MTNWLEFAGETRARILQLLRRSSQTITGLSEALDLTDNAVRTHIAAIERDGIVQRVGTERDTGGKPARVYGLTAEGIELFPKAYAFVLAALVQEVVARDGREAAIELLRAVGEKAASLARAGADIEDRIDAAVELLEGIGAEIDVVPNDAGWRLQGYGCPLSAVTAGNPEVCKLAEELIQNVTGHLTTECCDREGIPSCAFQIDRMGRPLAN
jgi:predicted ArsR family transcriptional regulator